MKSPPFLKDNLIRVLAFMTLTIVAVGFLLSNCPQAQPTKGQGEAHQTSQQGDLPKTFWEKVADDPVAFFTMTLAVLTAVLSATAVAQIYFLGSADRSTRVAARAAVRSANVAARTVRSIEETAERQLRAYIGIERAYVSNLSIANGPISATIVIKNGGQTPAFRVKADWGMYAIADGLEISEVKYNPYLGNEVTIMPGGNTETRFTEELIVGDINDLVSKDILTLWIVGRVFYIDVFGKERTTNVKMVAPKRQTLFVFARGGNDAS